MRLAKGISGLMVVALLAFAPAVAQADPATRAAQEAAFQRMYAAPTDPQASLDYARLSVALRDCEAAAAALERLVAIEPRNIAARQQLALAYFALGSNAMAERQMQIVAKAQGADPAVQEQARAYGAAAANRRSASQITGSLRFGSVFSSDTAARSTDADLALIWRHDLGGASGHFWLTTLNSTLAFDSGAGARSDRFSIALRSGPMFSLGTTRQSPRLQPFAFVENNRDNQSETMRRRGMGLLFQLPLGDRFSAQAEIRRGRVMASYSFTEGRLDGRGLSAIYRLTDRTSLRAGYDREVRRGLSSGLEVERNSALELWHQFQPGFSRVDKNWRVIASLRNQRIDEAGLISTKRIAGVVVRGWITDQTFADIGVTRSREVDGVAGQITTPTRISLRIGREF